MQIRLTPLILKTLTDREATPLAECGNQTKRRNGPTRTYKDLREDRALHDKETRMQVGVSQGSYAAEVSIEPWETTPISLRIFDGRSQRQVIGQAISSRCHRFTNILETRSAAIQNMSRQEALATQADPRPYLHSGGSTTEEAHLKRV